MDISPATWSTLSKLLDEALDLEPPARASWLEALAAAQPELTPALRKLLAAHATAESADMLARLPTLHVQPGEGARTAALAAGDRIGPYKLIAELGRGGMAEVWLAERADGALERKVALKLPFASRLRRDLAGRFARERDILARLEHPHIARLYDAGVDPAGLPYLAMEYVAGAPINAYCDAQRLDLHQRLALFVQVLDAVQYAHANLVIHRDLKPSNILVNDDGQVRLLDFGIAKLLDGEAPAHETQLTQLAGRVLTPDYASPEQVKGDALTIATDVYSLGVVLHELLAGSRPYRLKLQSIAQLEQAIVGAEPERVSASIAEDAAPARATTTDRLKRALAGDLDTIVLKALAKAPADRYATVAALADDLQRFLDGRPVQAQPASAWYRMRKFVARNQAAVGAGAGVAVALLLGTALTLWQAQEARRQGARAAAVKDFLIGLFEANSLEPSDSARRRSLTAGQLLDEGAQRIGTHFATDPQVKAELQGVVGRLLHDLSATDQALALRRERVATLNQMAAPARERAQAMRELADTLTQKGDIQAARTTLRDAIGLLGPGARKSDAQLRWSLVSALGFLEVESGDRELGAHHVEQAAEELRLLAPDSVDYAEALLLLAELRALSNRPDEFVAILSRAFALLERHYGPRSMQLARHRYRIAAALASQRHYAEAERQYRLALQTLTEAAGPSHPSTATVQLNLGRLLSIQGRSQQARALFEPAAATLMARGMETDPLNVANAHTYLAEALLDDGRIGEAGAPLQRAMPLYEGITNLSAKTVAQAIHARYLLETGRFDDALRVLESARDLRVAAFGRDHPAVASLTNRIGLVHMAAGRLDLAQRTFRAVLESHPNREQTFGSPQQLATINLAALDMERGRFASALPVIERFARQFEALPQSEQSRASELVLRIRLARALLGLGRLAEARTQAAHAQRLAADLYEFSPPRFQIDLLLARLRASEADLRGARAALASARQVLQAQPALGPHYGRALREAEIDVERGR